MPCMHAEVEPGEQGCRPNLAAHGIAGHNGRHGGAGECQSGGRLDGDRAVTGGSTEAVLREGS